MGIGKFFKKVFGSPAVQQIAPLAVGVFVPQFAPLVHMTVRAVLAAEDKLGGKTGEQKAAFVADQVAIFGPLIVQTIEQTTNREMADEDLFSEAMRDLCAAVVKVLNAFRVLPKDQVGG